MSMNEPKTERIQRAIMISVDQHWRFWLVEGIILVIFGLAAFIIPRTLMAEFQFGWLFLFSGITGLITTLSIREAPGFRLSLVSAILGIAAGTLMILSPTKVLSLTFILVLFFVIEGVVSIMYANEHKRDQSGRWVWMLGSGIIDLFLAVLVLISLPGSAKWALGLLVGVNLISGGLALVAMALHAHLRISATAT
jgi:uncharacterized membrane protein HdeD (DUF308 family)